MSTLTSDALKAAIAHAEELGNRKGMYAASWAYRAILKGIEDGDPVTLDGLPGPEDFLGPILHASIEAAGIDYADMTEDAEREILDAYDWMFSSAVENEVSNLAMGMGHLMGSDA